MNELIVEEVINYIEGIYGDERLEEEYNKLEEYIINKSNTVRSTLKYEGGIYYNIDSLKGVIQEANKTIEYFIINQLKINGIEYYNNTLYRVAE